MFSNERNNQEGLEVRRRAGQSIRDQKERLIDGRLVPFYWFPACLWLVCLVEFSHSWTKTFLSPYFWLFVALGATTVSLIMIRRLVPRFRNLNRGERGELRVADILDELRSSGYRPIHDLRNGEYNIDHVVVGPGGVFAIETKFRSGQGEIEIRDGEGVLVDGRVEKKDCLRQARGNAWQVNQMIKKTCRIDQWVTPVVVFVGDWRIKNGSTSMEPKLLSADQLVRYFNDQQPQLSRHEINLIGSQLEALVSS